MLSVVIRITSMRQFQWVNTTYNFMIKYENFPKYLNICFLELSKEFHRDSKEFKLAIVNEPLVFELLRYNCSFTWSKLHPGSTLSGKYHRIHKLSQNCQETKLRAQLQSITTANPHWGKSHYLVSENQHLKRETKISTIIMLTTMHAVWPATIIL